MEGFHPPWPPVILPPPRVWTPPDPCCILKAGVAGWSGEWKVELLMGVFQMFFRWGEIQKVFYFGLKILDDLVESWDSWGREWGKNMVHTSRDERWVEFFGAKVYQVKCCKGPIWFLHSRKRTWLAGRSPSSIGNAFHGLWKSLCNWVVYPPWN